MKLSETSSSHRSLASILYLFVCLTLCLAMINIQPASAAIVIEYYVDNTNDSKTNNSGCSTEADTDECSLRAAIQLVNVAAGTSPYLIHVPAGTYNLPYPGTDDTNTLGDLDIGSGHNLTIDGAGIDVTIINGYGHFDRIIDHQGEAELRLSDLTIQNGNLSVTGLGGGGGIRSLSTGELTLDNVRVTGNTVAGTTAADSGGGIFVSDADLSIIGGSQIDDNSACHGGGIMTNNGTLKTVHIESTDTTGNTARCDIGGGLLFANLASVDISQTTVSGNHAKRGAGYAQSGSTTSTISGITVNGNVIDTDGTGAAGMEIYGTATITGSQVSLNVAPTGIGGIRLNSGSTFTMTDSAIINNGGDAAGGLLVENNISALLQRIEITSNTATNGGGITAVNGGNIDLENVTIAGNTAAHYGGGLYLQGNDSADLDHVTIADNTGTLYGDAVYIDNNGVWSSKNSIFYYITGGDVCYHAALSVVASYGHNIIGDNTCHLLAGTDLADTDPLLGELDFYHSKLQGTPPLPGSPAIDGAITSDPVITDERGMPRVDGNLDGVIESDIGAHEYYPQFFLPVIIKS